MDLTAKSLILDLLSTLPRGSMPVRALIASGALFGFAENNIRVTLARLRGAGGVERDRRGCYRLSAHTEAVRRKVASWRHIQEQLRPWDGGWVGVHTGAHPPSRGRERQRHLQALRLLGFATLDRGLEVRPDNLAGGVSALREQLAGLGLDPRAPVFSMSELEPSSQQRAGQLWDGVALLEAYADSCQVLSASARRLTELPVERAMVESFRVGGRVLRQIVLDPLLPEPIVAARDRNALVDAMRDYDRLGRACWSGFLASFDLPHSRTPADLRVATAAAHIPVRDYGEGRRNTA